MNMNADQPDNHPQNTAPESIAKLLTSAAGQLDADTVAALRRARNVALARQSLHKPVLALSSGYGTHRLIPHSAQQWTAVAILLIAVLVSVVGYWHHGNEHDMSHLDIAILTDDLPMEIFVDQ